MKEPPMNYPPPPPASGVTPLDQEIHKAVAEGWTLANRDTHNAVLSKGGKVRHVMHAIISLLTCGVWLWGWAIVAILGTRQTMTLRTDENGAVHRQGPKPRWPWALGVVASFILVLSIGAATGSGTGGDGTSTSAETTVGASEGSAAVDASATESSKPSAKAEEPEPKVEKVEPEEPKVSVSQQQAMDKAADYLDYTAFSRSGLIQQLEYEGFSKADATYAVDNVEVNWMEQAAAKAADYLDYTAFSRSGLIQQLKFDGFTPKQAAHGADAVGL